MISKQRPQLPRIPPESHRFVVGIGIVPQIQAKFQSAFREVFFHETADGDGLPTATVDDAKRIVCSQEFFRDRRCLFDRKEISQLLPPGHVKNPISRLNGSVKLSKQ